MLDGKADIYKVAVYCFRPFTPFERFTEPENAVLPTIQCTEQAQRLSSSGGSGTDSACAPDHSELQYRLREQR